MPDLKSELKKLETLKFDDEGTTQTEITTQEPENLGTSATFFNVIRDNPGCNRNRLIALGYSAGVGKPSSSSLLAQFTKRGLIRTVDTSAGLTYFSVAKQYEKGYVKRPKTVKAVKATAAPAAPKQETNVSEMLSNMSILKARALYDELKQIFGG